MANNYVLVSGASGFIGSHTVVELLEAGFNVVGVDNFYNSDKDVIDGIRKIMELSNSKTKGEFYFEEIDCANYDSFKTVFTKYKGIVGSIHFAAYKAVSESLEKPLEYYRNNLFSLINLVDLTTAFCEKQNVVFSSSCTVYGEPALKDLPIKESHPLQKSLTPYGKTKQMCEDIIKDCANAYKNFNSCALRYFNPIGAHPTSLIGELPKGVPQNLVPYITQTAAGIRECLTIYGKDYNTPDGTCIRDYIWVVDLAKAHVAALKKMLDNTSFNWNAYNIGTGTGVSVLELVNCFIKTTGVDLKYKFGERRSGDVEQVWADATKAKRELGWEANTPLEDIIKSAWEWQKRL